MIDAPTQSSYDNDKHEECWLRCLNCNNKIYRMHSSYCNSRCRGLHIYHTKMQREERYNSIDIVKLLYEFNGNMSAVAREIGFSSNGVLKRFRKATGHQNWKTYINSMSNSVSSDYVVLFGPQV